MSMDLEGQFQTFKKLGEDALDNLNDIKDRLAHQQALPSIESIDDLLEQNTDLSKEAINTSQKDIVETYSALYLGLEHLAGNSSTIKPKNDYDLGITKFASGLIMLTLDRQSPTGFLNFEAGLSDLLTYATGRQSFASYRHVQLNSREDDLEASPVGEPAEEGSQNKFTQLERAQQLGLLKGIAQTHYTSVLSHDPIVAPILLNTNFFKSTKVHALLEHGLEGYHDLLKPLILDPFEEKLSWFLNEVETFLEPHSEINLEAYENTGLNYHVLNQLK